MACLRITEALLFLVQVPYRYPRMMPCSIRQHKGLPITTENNGSRKRPSVNVNAGLSRGRYTSKRDSRSIGPLFQGVYGQSPKMAWHRKAYTLKIETVPPAQMLLSINERSLAMRFQCRAAMEGYAPPKTGPLSHMLCRIKQRGPPSQIVYIESESAEMVVVVVMWPHRGQHSHHFSPEKEGS